MITYRKASLKWEALFSFRFDPTLCYFLKALRKQLFSNIPAASVHPRYRKGPLLFCALRFLMFIWSDGVVELAEVFRLSGQYGDFWMSDIGRVFLL